MCRPSGTWISPDRAISSGVTLARFRPSNVTVPPYGIIPEMARRVDVLPAPLGPSRAMAPSGCSSTSTPRTAWVVPYRTCRPSTSSTARHPQIGTDDLLVLPDLLGRPLGDDLAQLQDHQAVADGVEEVHLVVHHDDRHSRAADLDQALPQLHGLGRVQ